jgi:hypothetical protein
MTIKTQGTGVFFVAGTPAALQKMVCPTGVNGLGGARDRIDVTCLSDLEDHAYVGGLGNPGTVSIPFVFHPETLVDRALMTLKASGADTEFMIVFTDGPQVDGEVTPPTFAAGDMTPPEDTTSASFAGYIADVNIDVATNEVVRGTITVQRSGAVTWAWNGAGV